MILKQSQTTVHIPFLMVQSSDHVTGLTGASPTVTLSKNCAAFGAASGAVTEISSGWYKLAANATDMNTLGALLLHATATNADPLDDRHEVVAFDPLDAVRLGLTALPNVASGSAGAIPTTGTGANQISVASGLVDITQTAADKVWSSTTRTLSAFSTALAVSVWDVLASAVATASSIGLQLKTNIDATISSRLATAGYTAPLSAGATENAVWDAARASHVTAGSLGQGAASVQGNVTGSVGSVTGAVGSIGTAGISAGSFAAGAINAAAIAADAIGASELAADAVNEIADQVWDEVLSGHLTAGTTGAALNGAGAAGDPWSSTLPGAYGSGTAGKIIGDNINATISSRSSHTAADVWTSATRTLTSLGTLVADIWSYATRTLTTAIAAVTPPPVITGATVTITRGDTMVLPFTGLGDISGRSKLWLTVKASTEDADSAAIIQIEEGAGLIRLNGAAGTATDGTTTIINQVTGAVTFTLKPASTALLALSAGLIYDVQVLKSGVVTTLTQGNFVVIRDATRAVS
jgi:hypothetical protein